MARTARKVTTTETPAALGFRMPAEWEPHEATWIAWPHNVKDWPGRFAPIPWTYAEIVRQITRDEFAYILVNDQDTQDKATKLLIKMGVDLKRVRFFAVKTDRVWARDFGPIFVVKDKAGDKRGIAFTNWHFNAWAKYDDWRNDDAVPDALAPKLKLKQWKPTAGDGVRVVLEGGSIDVNGRGLLLTTEECLLSTVQQRNPLLSRQQIEQAMGEYLGIKKVLWLRNGIAGDDTHGHVDDLARFTDASTMVIVSEADKSDVNYEPLRENLALAREMKDHRGKPLRVATLPMPEPVVFDGQRLPASYANFYITNNSVLVPTFNDKNDRVALGILQELFPKRRVVGVHCLELVWGLGTLHCMTQQQPRK
jgi:agmatine deiminase